MILFTNGCSWTWGGGLEQYFSKNGFMDNQTRLKLVWPHYLGNLINVDKVINLSMGCGSNQRIVRTTYDWFLNEYDKTTPVIAIIQWSDLSRYEYYLTEDPDSYNNISENWALIKSGVILTNEKLDSKNAYEKSQLRLTTYTELEGMYQHLRDCTSLVHLFNNFKVKYYFFNNGFLLNFPDPYRSYIKNLNYLNGDCDWLYSRISQRDLHPNVEGHKELAQLIFNEIKF